MRPTGAIKQDIVVFYVTQTLLQPVKIVGEVLHTEDESSVGAKPQGVIFHHVVHLDKLPDICERDAIYY